jgi:hypothetical protein
MGSGTRNGDIKARAMIEMKTRRGQIYQKKKPDQLF